MGDGCVGGSGGFFRVEGLFCEPWDVGFFFVIPFGFQMLLPFLFFVLLDEVGDVLVECG